MVSREHKEALKGNLEAKSIFEWMKSKFGVADGNRRESAKEHFKPVPKPIVGEMLLFSYDPKHKETLPYYDTFPLIFVFDETRDYFMGLNLHYLNPKTRLVLIGSLMKLANNNKMDDTTKLNLSWDLLKSMSAAPYIRPCVKKYLRSNVRGNLLRVPADRWDEAVTVPSWEGKFVNSSQRKVWTESNKIITKGKI